MHKKFFITLALLSPVFVAQAQAPTPTPTQSTSAKKALVARILKIQQPGIDGMSQAMAERPALAVLDRAGEVLVARIAPEKREALGKDIQSDVKKYLDEAVPLVRDRAAKLAPQTVGVLLEEKFSEDELKQLAAMLESPVYNKYQQLGSEMQKVLLDKLLADTRGVMEPKINALEQTVAKRLGIGAPAGAGPAK